MLYVKSRFCFIARGVQLDNEVHPPCPPQSSASSRASSVKTRLESHASSSWTSECWAHRESQQPHPPPEAHSLEEQPHRFEQEAGSALHRRGESSTPPPHPVATSSYIPSTSNTRGDAGGRSCAFEPGKKWRWAKRNPTMHLEMKEASSKPSSWKARAWCTFTTKEWGQSTT